MELHRGGQKKIFLGCVLLIVCLFSACSFASEERIRLRDLDFAVLSEEVIPQELKKLIDEKKKEPFMLTYSDQDNLYICVGYGKQNTGGYSITVNDLYLAEDAVYVSTSLLGPEKGENEKSAETFPYIVLKTEKVDKTVIFE